MNSNLIRAMFPGKEPMSDEDYESVEHPRLEVHLHVATKFVQFGSLMGLTLVGSLVGAWRGRSLAAAGSGALRGARIGGVGGFVIAPVMTEMAVKGQVVGGRAEGRAGLAQHPDLPFFQNQRKRATPSRMMMLEPDRGQMRTDRFFFTGALGGLAVGGLLGPGLLTGALIGGASACVGAGLTNPMVLQDA